MEIDNSRAHAFRECPTLYYNKYERNGIGLEPILNEQYGPMDFGGRVHELLEEHYADTHKYPASENEVLELEAEIMLQAYKAHYPQESFRVVDCERSFRVAIPGTNHVLVGKMDLVVEEPEFPGELSVIDHKTENRSGKGNLPQKWAARDQCSLYLWAARHIYQKPIRNFIVNVLTRQSPKAQIGPTFPERQKLERTQTQLDLAIRDICYISDQIEHCRKVYGHDQPWPANRENCYTWGQCDFYQPCTWGWSEEIERVKFRPKEEYLHLAGVPILQP